MARYVILDNEYNDAIYYFDTDACIEEIIEAYKADMKVANEGEEAQDSFARWLSEHKFVPDMNIQTIYVDGPDYQPRFELGEEDA